MSHKQGRDRVIHHARPLPTLWPSYVDSTLMSTASCLQMTVAPGVMQEEYKWAAAPRAYPSITKKEAFPMGPPPTNQTSMYISLAQSMLWDLLASKESGPRYLEFLVSTKER